MHISPQLHYQCIIHQDNILARLCHSKTSIFTKRATGTTRIYLINTVQFLELIFACQCTHSGITVDNLGNNRGFGTTNQRNAAFTRSNIIRRRLQVVEERGASTSNGAGLPYTSQNVGVHKIRRHSI